jgi:UTP--glucose-1-phosphate uridylyltransferase
VEALALQPEKVVVVTSPEKQDLNNFLADQRVTCVFQEPRRGFGHAIAVGCGEEETLVLLGDTAIFGDSPVERMAHLLSVGIDGCVAVQQVATEHAHRYGMVEVNEGTGAIRRVVEKPAPGESPGPYAIAARYGLSRPLASLLQAFVAERLVTTEGEIGMTEFLNHAIAQGADIKAVPYPANAERIDCGNPDEYRRAKWLRWVEVKQVRNPHGVP